MLFYDTIRISPKEKINVLTDIISKNIRYKKLSFSGEDIILIIPFFQKNKLKDILESKNISYEIIKKSSLISFFGGYKKRFGIIFGLIFSLIMIFFLTNIVLRIEITGNNLVTENQIISMLKDCGITYGKYIPSLDLRKAEKKLLSLSDKFTDAHLRSSGFRIIVSVNEGVTDIDTVLNTKVSNIVSLYDAQITSVKVYSGILIPMKGDTVRKNEILISGIVPNKYKGTSYYKAMGEIIGKYNKDVSFHMNFIDDKKFYDEKFVNSYVKIFDKLYFSPKNKDIPENAEISKNVSYINFLSLTLPIEKLRLTVTPYHYEKVSYTENEIKNVLFDKLKTFENNLVSDKIIGKETDFIYENGGITLNAHYILEGNIGIEKIVFI